MPLHEHRDSAELSTRTRHRTGVILAALILVLLIGAGSISAFAWFTPHPVCLGPYALLGPNFRSEALVVGGQGGRSVAVVFFRLDDPIVPSSGMAISKEWVFLGAGGTAHSWAKVLGTCGAFRLAKTAAAPTAPLPVTPAPNPSPIRPSMDRKRE